ncbi:hypothetical protein H8E88_21765 [candidate division KSB1 bacterium]|nr:hypothetical protein [candidate division KSB1 bacterium]MBL7092838.1 hypothetical protein [candidate division KSB1 bacterium]
MKFKLFTIVAIFSVLVILLIGCKQKGLEGAWIGTEVEGDGGGEWTFTFEGEKCKIESTDGLWFNMTITLVENTDAKQAELEVDDSVMSEAVGLILKSIYKIEGKKLTIAVNDPQSSDMVPTSFDKSWDNRVFVLERKK